MQVPEATQPCALQHKVSGLHARVAGLGSMKAGHESAGKGVQWLLL